MRRKPLSGALIGILIGAAVGVILARVGVWPPDQLTMFLMPALVGLLGLTLLSIGRENSIPTMIIALLILVPMLVWGALGFTEMDQSGELNGGCTVAAESTVDSTVVTDTSRSDPFVVETDGGLAWSALSPEAFMDYDWQLHVVVGGFAVPIDSGTEANSAGDLENSGDVSNIGEFASERGINLDLYRGVYEVGGEAATCDGFGFVAIEGDGLDLVLLASIVLILLLVILYLILFFAGRSASTTESQPDENGDNIDVTGALGPYEAGSEGATEDDDRV